VAAGLLSAPLGIALALAACDAPPPTYSVPDTSLRIIPQQGDVGTSATTDLVLVELRNPNDAGAGGAGGATSAAAAAAQKIIIYVRVKGATAELLPGPSSACASTSGTGGNTGSTTSASGTGGAGTGGSSTGSSSASTQSSDLVIRDLDLVKEPAGVRSGAFLVSLPQGDAEAELVATAYQYDGADACHPGKQTVVAIGEARITRSSPPKEAGTGGSGGASGSTTSTTSTSATSTDTTSTTTGSDTGTTTTSTSTTTTSTSTTTTSTGSM
jgi:hypothetical protein